jgi:hypothetical protein
VDEIDCVDVRESRFAGRPLSGAEAEHAASCPVCSRAQGDALPGLPGDLFAELENAVQRDRGFTGWLRGLPTPVRLVAAIDSAAVLVLAMVLVRPRWTFGPMPLFRVVPVVAVLALELGVVLWLVLRPLYAAPPNRRLVVGSIVAGLLVPVLFALVPAAAPLGRPEPPDMTTATVACFLFGAVPGGLLVFALRALDRNAHGGTDVAILAAVGGGLAGNAALELHCPSAAPLHLLLGHATIGIALVVLYGVVRRSGRSPVRSP